MCIKKEELEGCVGAYTLRRAEVHQKGMQELQQKDIFTLTFAKRIRGSVLFVASQVRLNCATVTLFFPCTSAYCTKTAAVPVASLVYAVEISDKDFTIPAHGILLQIRPIIWLASTVR